MSETAKKYYCDKCTKEIISQASYWIIDNHRYCQECYKLNFSIDAQMKNKDEQIAQLKQQLVNKGKEIENLKDKYEQLELQKDYYIGELRDELKEQHKEILELKKFDSLNKTFFDLIKCAFKEQDKIDDLFNTLKTMETTYAKQVRKEMCDKIRENAISHNNLEVDMYYITPQQLYEIEQG